MTLETQYKNYKTANPESALTFVEWKILFGKKLEKAIKELDLDEPKFKVGDRLEADDYCKEQYGLEYVTITDLNKETKVYYWEADWNGGVIHSGYFFSEAKEYKEIKTPKEKAEELVNKYKWLKLSNLGLYLDLEEAKKCALIAVNEIIKTLNYDIRDINVRGNILLDLIDYWREVKNEIEKL
jgi:hypothetical protein